MCEAPFVVEHQGRFHLTYSGHIASTAEYASGGAVADHPLGPFERYPDNRIFEQVPDLELYGPGHHCIAPGARDDLLAFYHTKSTPKPGYDRRIRLAPASFRSGLMRIEQP